jgi:hypothetical protein
MASKRIFLSVFKEDIRFFILIVESGYSFSAASITDDAAETHIGAINKYTSEARRCILLRILPPSK